jgi:hypothetical protein
MKDESDSKVDATQAAAQTSSAQAGAGQATQGAASSTGASQAGAGAQGNLAQEETVSDVGQGEAYLINMKRLVSRELDLDAELKQITVTSAQRLARNAETFDSQVQKLALDSLILGQTALANAVALANRVNNSAIDLDTRVKSDGASSDSRRQDNAETHDKQMDAISVSERERTVRGGDAGDVIRWSGLSENPIFQDAISAAVAAGFEEAAKGVNKAG